MLWGLGTALGELPPYFMARAARLAHKPPPASVVHSKTPANMLEKYAKDVHIIIIHILFRMFTLLT